MSHFKKCGHFFGQLLGVQDIKNSGYLLYPFGVLVSDINYIRRKSVSGQKPDIILTEYVRYDFMYRTLIMSIKCPTFEHSKCPIRSPLFLVKNYPLSVLISDTLMCKKVRFFSKKSWICLVSGAWCTEQLICLLGALISIFVILRFIVSIFGHKKMKFQFSKPLNEKKYKTIFVKFL